MQRVACGRKTYQHWNTVTRYVGLRWSAPKPRKTAQRKTADAGGQQPPIPESPPQDGNKVVRSGKILSGFVCAEWDIYRGTFLWVSFLFIRMRKKCDDS